MNPIELNDFYEKIAKDSNQALITLLSEAGHGKSSSLRSIIGYIREHDPTIVWKIIDCAQAWYHNAPVKHRQLITRDKLYTHQYANIEDCVYEIGGLSDDEARVFLGELMKQDWDTRYKAKIEGRLDKLPLIAYVIEEANIFFGPQSFRKNDEYTPIFQKFVSVGRNYKLRGFLVATGEMGEMAPSLRDRSRKIYGRIISERDSRVIRLKDRDLAEYLKTSPKYTFVYYSDKVYGPVKIPDSVKHVPVDYRVSVAVMPKLVEPPKPVNKWRWFIYGAVSLGWAVAVFLILLFAAIFDACR